MKRTKIIDIFSPELIGTEVSVMGWVRTRRGNKHVQFLAINDGSTIKNLQVVIDMAKFTDDDLRGVTTGSSVHVTGRLVESMGKGQTCEVQAETLKLFGTADPETYPLQKKGHTLEFLREKAHLRPRTNTFGAILRVRSTLAFAIHKFFNDRGFVYAHPPIITCSDCEGAGEMFHLTNLNIAEPPRTQEGEVDYSQDFFGKRANLTVSGQLNAENFAMAFGDVYTFGPTFRAENSNTQRHAAEFWMIEPEMAFCDLAGDMDVAEAMIKHIIRTVVEKCPQEMAFFNSFVDKGLMERLEHVASSDFGRVSYTEAVELLKKNNDKFDYKVEWGCDRLSGTGQLHRGNQNGHFDCGASGTGNPAARFYPCQQSGCLYGDHQQQ